MTPKQNVLNVYPQAKCEKLGDLFVVHVPTKILSQSYINAAHAWKLAQANISKVKKLSKRQERIAFKILNGSYPLKSAENSPNLANRARC